MTAKKALLAIALLLLISPPLAAQAEEAPPEPPPPPPRPVNIQLNPGQPREIAVKPNVTGVCRRTFWVRLDCPSELNFRWTGPPGAAGERIQVLYQDGLYWDQGVPKKVAASECFYFPGGANPFELMHGPQNGKNLVFRGDNDKCPSKVAFFYDISCVGGEGGNCGGVETLDPGTMGDNGRR